MNKNLQVNHLSDEKMIKLKTNCGYISFGYDKSWAWSFFTSNYRTVITIPSLVNNVWDSNLYQTFIEKLKRGENAEFYVGDKSQSGLYFYVENGDLAFGYGTISRDNPRQNGLDI